MAKIRRGGVAGFARGSAGSYTFYILKAKNSASGKKEQIIKQKTVKVTNPKTTAQVLQRMKLGPASRFYNALETILSNAFQSVPYGSPSRRYFIGKCMADDAFPYIPATVDRFIPAEYIVSEGALPTVALASRANMFKGITLETTAGIIALCTDVINSSAPTPENFAKALGVSVDTQISFIVITNNKGIFKPHYLGFDSRLLISDLYMTEGVDTQIHGYEESVGVSKFCFPLANLGLPTENLVAAAIILSKQDASGKWLRSTQRMQLNDTLFEQLYGVDAMTAAIASYQNAAAAANAVGSQWYLNLGIAQAFNGSLRPAVIIVPLTAGGSKTVTALIGLRADGSQVIFAHGTAGAYLAVATVVDNKIVLDSSLSSSTANLSGFTVVPWSDSYAAQAGISYNPLPFLFDFDFPISPQELHDVNIMFLNPVTYDDLRSEFTMEKEGGGTMRIIQGTDDYLLFDNTDTYNSVELRGNTLVFGESEMVNPKIVSITYNGYTVR